MGLNLFERFQDVPCYLGTFGLFAIGALKPCQQAPLLRYVALAYQYRLSAMLRGFSAISNCAPAYAAIEERKSMTLQGINDAKHWRDRAAEMRVLSADMKDFEARTLMLKLANDYDKLADRAEDRVRL